AKGIEPSYAAWEAAVLPLNYAREFSLENQSLLVLFRPIFARCMLQTVLHRSDPPAPPILYRSIFGFQSKACTHKRRLPRGTAEVALGRHRRLMTQRGVPFPKSLKLLLFVHRTFCIRRYVSCSPYN